jgi:hypothetical protein
MVEIYQNHQALGRFFGLKINNGVVNYMYFGQCLCGTANIKITGEISDIMHCYCPLCRKIVLQLMRLMVLSIPNKAATLFRYTRF